MEIVCIDKQTFDELRVRFGKLEEKVMGMCRPVEDLGLKSGLTTRRCARYCAYPKDASGVP